MKKLLFACAGLAALTAAARPSVDPDKVKVGMDERHNVRVEYELAGSPAVVTVEFQTNTLAQGAGEWVKLGGDVVRIVRGDVNCLVRTTGAHSFVWKAARDWRDRYIADGRFRAKLTVWPTSAPPTWLVCGLEKKGDVRYYEDPDYIPGGLSNDLYKTHCLLMRKCPAAGVTWLMGSQDNESLREEGEEQRHNVMLTEDYYAAVYETTYKQYRHIINYPTSDADDRKPILYLEFKGLRGSTYEDAVTHEYCWPQDGHTVAPDSVIGKLRDLSGLDDFDLPTEAQWEYACRAGESYMFCNGTPFDPRAVGLYSGDSDSTGACHEVGERQPNNWGIYDMHGNVAEFCLDHYSKGEKREATFAPDWREGGVTVDPKGREDFELNSSGVPMVVKRGGAWNWVWNHARAASAYAYGSWYYGSNYCGFRLFRPAVAK